MKKQTAHRLLLALAACWLALHSAEAQLPWNFVPAQYQFSMQAIARIRVGGVFDNAATNRVAGFSGGQVRGTAAPVLLGGQAYYFLSIHSNGYVGDKITFFALIAAEGRVYECADTVPFQHLKTVGTLAVPLVLNFSLSNKPLIYTPSEITFAEGTCPPLFDIQASDDTDAEGSGLTYSATGGADVGRFTLNPQTGLLNWSGSPPTANPPADANADNIYEISVRVTDSGGQWSEQALRVKVVPPKPPAIICPANLTVLTSANGTGDCSTTVTGLNLVLPPANCGTLDLSHTLSGATQSSATGQVPVTQVFPLGITTVQYAVSAGSNPQTSSCQFSLTVIDDEPPSLACKPAALSLGANGMVALSAAVVTQAAADNCGGAPLLSVTPSSFGCADLGQKNVTLRAIDAAGNTATCQATVTVQDALAPTVVCKNTTVTLGTGPLAPATVFQSSIDNCGAVSLVSILPNTFSCSDLGAQTVVLHVADAAGNTATCSATVSIVEGSSGPPNIVCPPSVTVNLDANCAVLLGAYSPVSASISCANGGMANVTQTPAPGSPLSGHNTAQTVTLTNTDAANNTATCTFSVTVKDATPPTLSCPANQTVNLTTSCATTLAAYAPSLLSDGCSPSPALSQMPAVGSPLSGHNTAQSVTLTATDAAGNSTTCIFSVKLKDVAAPTLSCPANQTLTAGPNCSVALGTYPPTALSDHCSDAPTWSQSPAAGTLVAGSQVVTLTAEDGHGNATTCTLSVTSPDQTPPVITCPPNQVVAANASCLGTVGIWTPATQSDNCTPSASIGLGQNPAASAPLDLNETRSVTLTATDGASNSTTCSFSVTLQDLSPPSIACPPNVSVNTAAGQCSAVATFGAATAADNCSGATVSQIGGLASGSVFPGGLSTVTWQAVDGLGNSTTCAIAVRVNDGAAPSITCPGNLVRNADAGQCTAVVTYTTPTFSDNCNNSMLTRTSGLVSGSAFPKGVTLVSWQVSDGVNAASCGFTVTVNDNQLPSIACPANLTRNTDPGFCSAVVTYSPPTVMDNCMGASAAHISGGQSGAVFPKGLTTVLWRATDAAGLTRTCTFRVTVTDGENPVIVCPQNIAATTANGACTSAPVTYASPTATDNCPPPLTVTRTAGPSSGSAFPLGTTTVVWRAMDAAARSSTCSFSVTVTDSQPPVLTCPQHISVTAAPGQCSMAVMYSTPTVTDNCGASTVFLLSGLASGSVFPQGVTTNVWRATDNSGLSQTCAFSVTVSCGTGPQTFQVLETWKVSEQRLDLRLYPNPATAQLQIFTENMGEGGGELRVLDAQGRLMWQQKVAARQQQVSLDLGERWESGLYLVMLRSEGRVATERLAVQR